MKQWIVFILATGIANTAQAHPMQAAVQTLAKAAAEFRELESDPALGQEAANLKAKVEALWVESITSPLKSAEARLQSHQELDATKLQLNKWTEYLQQIEETKRTLAETKRMLSDGSISGPISQRAFQAVQKVAGGNRMVQLDQLRIEAQDAVDCILYFKRAFYETGLHPILDSHGNYAWNLEDLQRVYGVLEVSKIREDRRQKAASEIRALLNKAIEFKNLCVNEDAQSFLLNQADFLGAQK